jgi:excisionase family DNA binding protein
LHMHGWGHGAARTRPATGEKRAPGPYPLLLSRPGAPLGTRSLLLDPGSPLQPILESGLPRRILSLARLDSTNVDDEFLTVMEVAETLKLNPQTVRNWIDRGELSAVRLGSRRVRIKRSDLDAFLARGSRTATTKDPVSPSSSRISLILRLPRRWTVRPPCSRSLPTPRCVTREL